MAEVSPSLQEYRRRQREDPRLFWRLASGDHQNLLEEAIEQIDSLRQALWDVYAELGFDTDGDKTPAAIVGDLGQMVVDAAKEYRKDNDEGLDELGEQITADVAIVEEALTDHDEFLLISKIGSPHAQVVSNERAAAVAVMDALRAAGRAKAPKVPLPVMPFPDPDGSVHYMVDATPDQVRAWEEYTSNPEFLAQVLTELGEPETGST